MMMQTQSRGVSLYDIQEEFEVSRRTAERMRDAVVRIFPQIEVVDSLDKIRRWKFKTNYNGLVAFTPEEILEIDTYELANFLKQVRFRRVLRKISLFR
jgi:predicted DNA-binding transcriptional regulator YafY